MSAPQGERAGPRFLLYDVTPVEGFNLRRDVMVRAALLARKLGPTWTLVLPPFPRMRHWRDDSSAALLPWGRFFDLEGLADFVPFIEYETFAARRGPRVDRVLELVPDHSDFNRSFTISPLDASGPPADRGGGDPGVSEVKVFGETETLRAGRTERRAVFAPYSALTDELRDDPAESVMVRRLEVAFWDGSYGSEDYWRIRASVRPAPRMRETAKRFVRARMGAGPWLGVHLRRGDFLAAGKDLPTLEEVAEQVAELRARHDVGGVFLATDASGPDLHELAGRMSFQRYQPDPQAAWSDGEIALLEQTICALADVFVGTATSTFTDAIRQEREILGQPAASTWNELCRPRLVDGRRVYDVGQPPRWPWVGPRPGVAG